MGLFAAVMAAAQVGVGGRPDLLVSLVSLGLLTLLAASRVPFWGAVLASGVAWGWEGFGPSFLPAPVVLFFLLQGRVRWGDRGSVRAGLGLVLAGIAAAIYWEGLVQSWRLEVYLAHLQTADAYARAGRFDPAVQEQVRGVDPRDAEFYQQAGYRLEQRGNFSLAISQYQKAVTLEPGFFLGYYDLGYALESVGDLRGAEAAYRRSVEIAPRFYGGHLRLGTFYLKVGAADSAEVRFRKAVEIEPGKPEAYVNLGRAYQKQGRDEDAVRAYEAALRIDPEDVEAQRRLKVARQRR